MDKNVLLEYPNAEIGYHVTEKYLSFLSNEYKSDLGKMLFATSLCSDDVNVSTDFRRVLKRPFTMGGLGGVPFSGFTGMVAFAHHIPDDGDAFIFYGPHIGITEAGELGRMRRQGQSHETNSCGALMLALARLRDQTKSPFATEDPMFDYQQMRLEEMLKPYREEILDADNPIKKTTDVMYDLIHKKIHKLAGIAKSEFSCERLFVLGGVIINTPPEVPDYVDVRNFEVFTIADLEEEKPVSILKIEAFKNL